MNRGRLLLASLLCGALWFLWACGGSSSSNGPGTNTSGTVSNAGGNSIAATGASNVQAVQVTADLNNMGPNLLFATVKVCKPNTATCATIPNVLVDTGSYGLRVVASPVGASGTAVMSLGLTPVTAISGKPLAECVQFLDNSFMFGLVMQAEVQMGGLLFNGETTATNAASGIPIHVLGDSTNTPNAGFPSVPNYTGGTCGSGNPADAQDTPGSALGANGVLGIGPFIHDCPLCASSTSTTSIKYYSINNSTCSSSSNCTQATVPLTNQVMNPVAFFADNNGIIIELLVVGASGQTSVTNGALVFGIGTNISGNNALGSATVLPLSTTGTAGNFTTKFRGQSYSSGFVDSGSNGLFFLDTSTTGLPACTGSYSDFYCPASPQSFACPGTNCATNIGTDGTSVGTSFSIANATQLFNNNPTFAVFSNVGGPLSGYFDWGLSFFYGRNVFFGIMSEDGVTVTPPTGVPSGPFVAY